MWVAQGEYMTMCTTSATKGFYFGYFWVWYMMAQVLGNLLGALIINRTTGPIFFIIMATMMLVTTFVFFCLKNPKKFESI